MEEGLLKASGFEMSPLAFVATSPVSSWKDLKWDEYVTKPRHSVKPRDMTPATLDTSESSAMTENKEDQAIDIEETKNGVPCSYV
ncbi:hypothetical protein N7488_006737 [Penicillium malachiteum]|nr:hypothetical protein N7488_006737 [Penicillium malachiteum]